MVRQTTVGLVHPKAGCHRFSLAIEMPISYLFSASELDHDVNRSSATSETVFNELCLCQILSFVGYEDRAVLSLVSRSFNANVTRLRKLACQRARNLVLDRTIGDPDMSPFGFGMITGQNNIERVCVVYREEKAWFNAESGTEMARDSFRSYPLHVRAVNSGQFLAVMFNDAQGEAIVYNTESGQILQRFLLRELRGLCWPIALSPCGQWLAFPFRKSVVNVGSLATGRYAALYASDDFRPRGVGFSQNGSQVLVSGVIGNGDAAKVRLNLYDVRTQTLQAGIDLDTTHRLPCREGFVEFSPTGRLVLIPTRSAIAVVNLAQKRIVHTLRTRSIPSQNVVLNPHLLKPFDNQFASFSPDGSWVVTTREKRGWLQIWDLATGQELQAIDGGHYWAWPLNLGRLLTCIRGSKGWQLAMFKCQKQGTKRKNNKKDLIPFRPVRIKPYHRH